MENPNNNNNTPVLDFDFIPAEENHSIIKVVGVGGGGSNAVQHMYDAGIEDVSFLIINTDKQALKGSSIPHKLLISEKGLGAGAKPEIAHDFALQYAEQIRNSLSDGTEMVFITAGMGGGTGTGAAPIVAQIAQEMGILTVGIVTIPFRFEGRKKIKMALEGVSAIEKWCDALLVVNNNRLIDVYPDLTFGNAFAKADDTLTTAAKSISDIINKQGYINLDFADVATTLRGGGVALISTGSAQGDNRLSKAIKAAIDSPLLQDNNINDSRHLLFEICFSHDNPISMAEIAEMNRFVDSLNGEIEVIWGAMYDDDLGDDVRIIILASGFSMDHSTGTVFAGSKIEQFVRDLEKQLRASIVEKQDLLFEFDGYPEASEILMDALRLATDKANHLTLDDSLEDEQAKLNIALDKAREKKQAIIDEENRRKLDEENRQREEAIRAQIAALQAQLNFPQTTPVETASPAASDSPETKPQPAEAAQPDASQVHEPAATPVADAGQPEADTKPAFTPVPSDVTVHATSPADADKPAQPVSSDKPVQPARDVEDGIDLISRYYGEEEARKFQLSDARKAYYVLDNDELTNEELIRHLEQIPAYNRTLEDLGQLRVISRQPAQPKVIGQHDNPDGTIKF